VTGRGIVTRFRPPRLLARFVSGSLGQVPIIAHSHRAEAAMAELLVPISPGELIDKITILEIKSQRMSDATKLHNVRTELRMLTETWNASGYAATDISAEWAGLRAVNEQLWEIEDRIRDKERDGAFDAGFIELARAVYVTNDERAAIKKRINTRLGSALVEEKSYADYKRAAD